MVENICAIATPYGTGAISIIRCSGPQAIDLVNRVFKGKNLKNCKSHTIHYGYIMDGTDIVDEVLCRMMDAEISRLRMVAISLSNFGIRPIFANSSSSSRT